jgi:hypothetical protein
MSSGSQPSLISTRLVNQLFRISLDEEKKLLHLDSLLDGIENKLAILEYKLNSVPQELYQNLQP